MRALSGPRCYASSGGLAFSAQMTTVPATPCAFDEDFLADLPYDPDVLMFDRLLEVDRERSLVRCRMVTELPLPLTSAQRVHPVRHPQHLAGGLIIHATGSLGFVHAYYVLGLRHRDGWIGYGTHIHKASFRRLIAPGEQVEGICQATRFGMDGDRRFIRYRLELRSQGKRCYRGDHSGLWMRVDGAS
jgi:3-hydroxymyristoyl/3-hydroxydecanoyl-(acyl carrier protein) dehydratase